MTRRWDRLSVDLVKRALDYLVNLRYLKLTISKQWLSRSILFLRFTRVRTSSSHPSFDFQNSLLKILSYAMPNFHLSFAPFYPAKT